MKTQDLTLLAYVRTCAEKYPHMTIGRIMELADTLAKEIDSGKLEIQERRVPLGDRRFKENKPCVTKTDELSDMEALLLDRLAAYGPEAKVKSAALIDDLDLTAMKAGFILRDVMKKGYCEKVQEKPFALWRALKDSEGNPPVLSAQKDVPVTKCPQAYAYGYGYKQPSIG